MPDRGTMAVGVRRLPGERPGVDAIPGQQVALLVPRGRRRLSGIEQSDAELLAAVRLGDRDAFHALYQRFSPDVYTLCERILHSRHEAEDATADVFCEVWFRRERYDAARGGARTYLMTLGRSRAIDRLRSHAARPDMTNKTQLDGASLPAAPAPAPDDAAASAELKSRVTAALAALNSRQRAAMELAYFEGMSHREIADKLVTPLGTVKTHIRQGLAKLRTALGARGAGEI
jgi:RNA polymerase sigma-70 factor (ECF subfamily)